MLVDKTDGTIGPAANVRRDVRDPTTLAYQCSGTWLFASLHLLAVARMGCSDMLGHSMTSVRSHTPVLAIPQPVAGLAFGDLQHRGPWCAFCCIGQCHCQLIIEFNVLAIFGVTAVCPRLSRPEPSLRDPLNQFLRLVLGPTYHSHAATLRAHPRSDVFPDQLFG